MEIEYYSAHKCINCNNFLSETERVCSNGVCPECGHITKGTVCQTKKVAIKETFDTVFFGLFRTNVKWEEIKPEQ